jgi:hypothetical protein
MQTTLVGGVRLYFDEEEQDAAGLIGSACERTAALVRETWGLEVPRDLRVYVMTSWLGFFFRSAPWHWRILLGISLPLWFWRVRRLWPYAGGWAQRYGGRQAVGVKPPRLVEAADGSLGERIFVQRDVAAKVAHVACHELVHAFTAHLRLPAWLNEGLAMVTVDRYAGRPTVRDDTVLLLEDHSREGRPEEYGRLGVRDREALLYHYVRGYWLTRYLADERPELLKRLLNRRRRRGELENEVAAALGMEPAGFWDEIDGVIAAHYRDAG